VDSVGEWTTMSGKLFQVPGNNQNGFVPGTNNTVGEKVFGGISGAMSFNNL